MLSDEDRALVAELVDERLQSFAAEVNREVTRAFAEHWENTMRGMAGVAGQAAAQVASVVTTHVFDQQRQIKSVQEAVRDPETGAITRWITKES